MNVLILITALLSAASASPNRYFHFDQDVTCQSEDGTMVKVSYDKSKNLELGRRGEIQFVINTGRSSLGTMASAVGENKTLHRVFKMNAPAGMVGNLLQQSSEDPFVTKAMVGFKSWELLAEDGSHQKYIKSFIATIRTSRIFEHSFPRGHGESEKRELILVEIHGGLSGFGDHSVRFVPEDCSLSTN